MRILSCLHSIHTESDTGVSPSCLEIYRIYTLVKRTATPHTNLKYVIEKRIFYKYIMYKDKDLDSAFFITQTMLIIQLYD